MQKENHYNYIFKHSYTKECACLCDFYLKCTSEIKLLLETQLLPSILIAGDQVSSLVTSSKLGQVPVLALIKLLVTTEGLQGVSILYHSYLLHLYSAWNSSW